MLHRLAPVAALALAVFVWGFLSAPAPWAAVGLTAALGLVLAWRFEWISDRPGWLVAFCVVVVALMQVPGLGTGTADDPFYMHQLPSFQLVALLVFVGWAGLWVRARRRKRSTEAGGRFEDGGGDLGTG